MTKKSPYHLRLKHIRTNLESSDLAGVFIPRTDEFQGEYVPACAQRLKWISGFTGSWGSALISMKKAALIVDGRYTIQAAQEAPNYELLPPDNTALHSYLSKNFNKSEHIGFDPWTTSIAETRHLTKSVEAAGMKLKACAENLVDKIWQDRPAPPQNPIYDHPLVAAGKSSAEKIKLITTALAARKCQASILTDPHSVAWALNVRGSDVEHTPLALVRAIVFANGNVRIFAEKSRFTKSALKSFSKKISIQNEDKFLSAVTSLAKSKSPILLDPDNCPETIRLAIVQAHGVITEAQDPCALPRARKNLIEQKGARNAQLRDGAALTNFLHWLSQSAHAGKLNERLAEVKLAAFRKATGKLKDLSFGSISAAGPSAALPHYHVTGTTGRKLKPNQIYLIDSGGQYQDGTTDVTRTVIIGKATTAMKRHNTLVLKGMIAVSMARFPVGTTGVQLDALARAALWQQGFDFDHGTGHGVGSYLSVHEGPARISKAGHVALEPGMILSNEPGYYLKGKYGIRIENLLLVKPAAKPKGGDRAMLSFETLTFAPIDKGLIDETLLNRTEIQWLDAYHAEVCKKLSRKVATKTKPWLEEACAPLTKNI